MQLLTAFEDKSTTGSNLGIHKLYNAYEAVSQEVFKTICIILQLTQLNTIGKWKDEETQVVCLQLQGSVSH